MFPKQGKKLEKSGVGAAVSAAAKAPLSGLQTRKDVVKSAVQAAKPVGASVPGAGGSVPKLPSNGMMSAPKPKLDSISAPKLKSVPSLPKLKEGGLKMKKPLLPKLKGMPSTPRRFGKMANSTPAFGTPGADKGLKKGIAKQALKKFF